MAVVRNGRRRRRFTAGLAIVLAALGLAAGSWWFVPEIDAAFRRALPVTPAAQGMLAIDTVPAGWDVIENGLTLGTTPLRVQLSPGPHTLVLRHGTANRQLDVVLQAGAQVFHHLDLQAASPAGGTLNVTTTPAGAMVEVDGSPRGTSPIEVTDLAPGEHSVTVVSGASRVTERVAIASGRTTALVVPVGRPEAADSTVGFVTIAAPIDLEVFDGDALIGSSRNQRVIVMAGRRTLRLSNPALGFERSVTANVEAGAVTRLTVPVPNGSISVNAQPWAEVLVDGRSIGETPIANHAVSLGSHEILLRNPKFPEQKRTVVVTLTAPTRIGVDLRQ